MAEILENMPLAPHTYYRIGGPARYFAEAENRRETIAALNFAREKGIPFFILGAGSNMLVSDAGFAGLAVKITGREISVSGGGRMRAEAGAPMPLLASRSAAAGLAGLQWGIGIPGTVGGSVRGNAGSYGGEIKDALEKTAIYDFASGDIREIPAADCEFGYRASIFKKRRGWVVLDAVFKLQAGDRVSLMRELKELSARRVAEQAIGAKSAGCVFQNIPWDRGDIDKEKLIAAFPELNQFRDRPNIPAAYCIDAAGLKGARSGGAEISLKHANYFINLGQAAARDIMALIALAKNRVREKFGLQLIEEIQLVGFE